MKQFVDAVNLYVTEQAPWVLAKDEAQAERLRTVLRSLAEGLHSVTVLLHPYLPQSTRKLIDALGHSGEDRFGIACAAFGAGAAGTPVGDLAPLFPKPE